MAAPHRQWLAAQVLSDQQTVSYRTLARALKVRINAAKRMLYDFHTHENAKKPGSVHATYLLAGVKTVQKKPALSNGRNGTKLEDEPVPSSPPPFTSSMLQSSQQNGDGEEAEMTSVQTITLVREESLDVVKSSYETITSIHIYSLSAYRLQDLQTLSDTGRHLYDTYFVKEDPLEHNAIYGVIVNKNVRRRTGRGPPPPTVEPKATIKSETTSRTNSKTIEKAAATLQASVKEEEISRPSSAGSTTPTSTTTKQPSLKRDTSDIFKAFSKAKNSAAKPKPNLNRNGTDSSIGSKSEDKDSKLANASEDEGESEEEALFLDTKTRTSAKKRSSTGRSEREAKLRKMMDDSDEEMEDAQLIDPQEAGLGTGDQPKKDGKSETAALKQGAAQADEAEEGEEGVNWSDSDAEQQPQQPKTKETAAAATEPESDHQIDPSAPPKRRRGKRKVMKKKTMKDEEGYLVTREEAVWESFSEDEPVPAKTKPKPPVASKTQSQSQSQPQSQGKGGAKEKGKQKGGGGNIMSFFGKK